MSKTWLERELEDPASARPTPLRVFQIAREWFAVGRRLDMTTLAAESGVSRATLNRWVGSREKLLGEVLYALADASFAKAEEHTKGEGLERVLAVLAEFFTGVLVPGPFRTFVQQEPELALRLCTSKHGPVQRRLIVRIETLLDAESITFDDDTTTYEMAYALLRIGESFVYSDVITGGEPDIHGAVVIWRRMLR